MPQFEIQSMKYSNRATYVRIAAAICLLATSLASAQHLHELDAALEPLVTNHTVSGVVSVVTRKGITVHAAAYGNRSFDASDPMQLDTIFRAYSMTKPVTAVAMMILYDEGKWRLDDPVSKVLPELSGLLVFKGLDAQGKPILVAPRTPPTMAQILTQTAGFSYGFDSGYVDDQYRIVMPLEAESSKDFVQRVARLPLRAEPGTEWRYSLAVDLQGVIVERLSGMSLADFFAKRIFAPLRMVDSGFHVPAEKRSRFAALYTADGEKLVTVSVANNGGFSIFSSEYREPPGFAMAGAGMVTTAVDYERFGRMLLNGGVLDSRRILSRRSARMIMTNHIPPFITRGGYGIGLQQIRPGYEFGFNGVVVTDPERATVDIGKGSYLWDGAAGTWFWIDPANQIVFVGMLQRMMPAGGMPNHQAATQAAMRRALGTRFRITN
jgi:CubicO group peptidase (beta-lactamase class C family)